MNPQPLTVASETAAGIGIETLPLASGAVLLTFTTVPTLSRPGFPSSVVKRVVWLLIVVL